jgi:dTDP-4-dehydrorhamnose 3,5-epimerase
VRFDDPDLAIAWPLPAGTVSARDAAAGSWPALRATLATPED